MSQDLIKLIEDYRNRLKRNPDLSSIQPDLMSFTRDLWIKLGIEGLDNYWLTLKEKQPQPKYKIGDKVVYKGDGYINYHTITDIIMYEDGTYNYNTFDDSVLRQATQEEIDLYFN